MRILPLVTPRLPALAATVGVIALLLPSEGAWGACRYVWDCTRPGQCRQVPICESPLDLPGIPSVEIPPIAPPTIAPVPPIVLPPVGTSECRSAYLCDTRGRCRWKTVCQ
jgi:hypothetical protein